MYFRRGSLILGLLSGAVVSVIMYRPGVVEARSTSPSSSVETQIFSAESLPSYDSLVLQQEPLPEGKGRDLAQKYCGTCHATAVWTNKHHTQEQWATIIDDMVSKGLKASDDDLATINDYLTLNFGKVVKDPSATPPPGAAPAAPPVPQ